LSWVSSINRAIAVLWFFPSPEGVRFCLNTDPQRWDLTSLPGAVNVIIKSNAE